MFILEIIAGIFLGVFLSGSVDLLLRRAKMKIITAAPLDEKGPNS